MRHAICDMRPLAICHLALGYTITHYRNHTRLVLIDIMTVTLRPITRDNWRQCTQLNVARDQIKFVATNVYSLAQAYAEPERLPMAIYDGEEMVGFVSFNERPRPDGTYRISRLMIDQHYQRRGYARTAMQLVLARLRGAPEIQEVMVDYHRLNRAAANLYESLGFVPFEEQGDEVIARLRF